MMGKQTNSIFTIHQSSPCSGITAIPSHGGFMSMDFVGKHHLTGNHWFSHCPWNSGFSSIGCFPANQSIASTTMGFATRLGLHRFDHYWLVVWNMFFPPYIRNNHPKWLIFFRGIGIPPTSYGIHVWVSWWLFRGLHCRNKSWGDCQDDHELVRRPTITNRDQNCPSCLMHCSGVMRKNGF